MNPLCKTCDMHTATHWATNPRETDCNRRSWRICGRCIRQAIAHGLDLDYTPLPETDT